MVIRLACALALTVLFHLAAMAICARALGFTVRTVCYGVGPRLAGFRHFQVALLPIGGQVRLATLADTAGGLAPERSYERQAGWRRLLLALCGPLALLGLGWAFLHDAAFEGFAGAFGRILGGAAAPFGRAQLFLEEAAIRLAAADLRTTIGLVACTLAALNLIPFTGSNGFQALLPCLPPRAVDAQGAQRWQLWASLPLLYLLAGGWSLACVRYLLDS